MAFVELADNRLELWRAESGEELKVDSFLPGRFEDLSLLRQDVEALYLSPGIDPRRSFARDLRDLEEREVDLFCANFKGKTVVVTGTDGKSSLCLQLGYLLRKAFDKQKIFIGGNIGRPMIEALSSPYDWAVLEVSSFQAERLKSAQFNYGILTNLAPDHLDRYDSLEDYYEVKRQLVARAHQSWVPGVNTYSENSEISEILKVVAFEITQAEGLRWNSDWLSDLPVLPHRQEACRDRFGERWVNDSKATNVHAARYGYEIWSQKSDSVLWLLGGRPKGEDFRPLFQSFRDCDRVCLWGEAREALVRAALDAGLKKDQIHTQPSLREGISWVLGDQRPGELVLLSPACSSYDEFQNFEERGDFFFQELQKLKGPLRFERPRFSLSSL
jgi:UDP-N-acetylmuramoylalanine--D-glutamate ligase